MKRAAMVLVLLLGLWIGSAGCGGGSSSSSGGGGSRHAREDGVGDVGGDVAHPPRAASRAQAALFTGEGHEDVMAACASVAAHEALRESPHAR